MVKNTVKNYFKNILYLFIPMGIIYLTMLVSSVNLGENVLKSFDEFLKNIGATFNSHYSNAQDVLKGFVDLKIEEISNAGNIIDSIKLVFSKEYLSGFMDSLKEFISTEFSGAVTDLESNKDSLINDIIASIAVFLSVNVFAIMASYVVTRFLLRRELVKRKFSHLIFGFIVNAVFNTLFIVGTIVLAIIWPFNLIFMTILLLVLAGFNGLYINYLIYKGSNRLKFKNVVNVKNLISAYLAYGAIFIMAIFILILVYYLFGTISAILVCIPLIIYSLPFVDTMFESYISKINVRE